MLVAFELLLPFLLAPFAFVGIVGLGILVAKKKRKAWTERLTSLGQKLDLEVSPAGLFKRAKASGRVGSFGVVIDAYSQKRGNSSTLYSRITLDPPIPEGLSVSKESFLSGLAQRFIGEDIRAGLPLFDDTFVLKGVSDPVALSMLGQRSRAALWNTVSENNFGVSDGKLVYRQVGYLASDEEALAKVELLVELGEALTEFAHRPAAGLLHHAFSDPAPAYRSRCFDALLRHYWGSSECQEAMELGRQSEDPNFLFLIEQRSESPNLDVVARLVRGGQLDEPLQDAATAMLGNRFAGGLSLGNEEAEGALSVSQGNQGALSREEARDARPARPKKQPQ